METIAIRELFEDPEFVQHFQNAILISAIVAANSERDEKVTELEQELSETKEQLARTNEELSSTKRRLQAMESYGEAGTASPSATFGKGRANRPASCRSWWQKRLG